MTAYRDKSRLLGGGLPARGGPSSSLRFVDRPWSPRLRLRLLPTSLSPLRSRRRSVGSPPLRPASLYTKALSPRDTPSERACVFSGRSCASLRPRHLAIHGHRSRAGREKHPPVKAARDGCRNVARKGVSREDQGASVCVAAYMERDTKGVFYRGWGGLADGRPAAGGRR